MSSNNPKRNKLFILAEQLRKHAKASNLQAFIMIDGDEPGMAKALGNYSEGMVQTIVAHMAITHPDIFSKTIEMINKMAEAVEEKQKEIEGATEVAKEEERPSLIVVP